ncbi:methionine--tRNA ligase, cytoplasmic-like, partial [Saccoglossus kowalevskii]
RIVPYLARNKLPVLELNSGDFIFSANIITRYLLCKAGKDSDDIEVDEWIEWEASQLQAILQPYLVGMASKSKCDVGLVTGILNYLNSSLKGSGYLVKDTLSAADIIVWSSLYPLFAENTTLQSQHASVNKWFQELLKQQMFQSAVTMVTQGKGVKMFYDSIAMQPVTSPSVVHHKKLQSKGIVSEDTEVQSNEKCTVASPSEVAMATDAWYNGCKSAPLPYRPSHPIYPVENKENILITSALPYVNNVPHLGNIIGCVLSADAFA